MTTRDEPTGLLPRSRDVRHIAGTPENMAPEMAAGDGLRISERTDVYLLGAMLHKCLTGKPRHSGTTILEMLLAAHLSAPVDYSPSMPAELAGICNRAMHANLAKRFQSAEEFRQAIVDFRRHQSSAELSREALQRLAILKRSLDVSDDDTADQVYRLFDECRFGFQQALKTWPANLAASKGLNEAFELMARREIARQDAQAAALLIAEMNQPPPELLESLRGLEHRLEVERQEVDRLRQMKEQLDPEIGRLYREGYAIMIAVVFGIIHLLTGYAERRGWFRVSMEMLQIQVVFFLLLSCGFMCLARKLLARTEVNRRIRNMLGLLLFMMTFLTVACRLLGIGVHETVVLVMLLCSVTVGALAVSVDRRLLWPSLFYFLGFITGAKFPGAAFEIIGVTNLVALIQIAAIWRGPMKVRG